MTRVFNAPAALVFKAFTTPDLVRRWLTGPPGWVMTVCTIDLRVGGKYRWVWSKEKEGPEGSIGSEMTEMGMGGEYKEIKKPTRVVCTEVFDQSWYEGEGLGEVDFLEKDGKTTMVQTLTYVNKAARDQVFEIALDGVEYSYNNLETLLGTL
jgi:uncharacterized protein YndB with AHSA1/START domain